MLQSIGQEKSAGRVASELFHIAISPCFIASPALGANRVHFALTVDPELDAHSSIHSQAKIALKASSENQLVELETAAKDLNLCARAVNDPFVAFMHSSDNQLISVFTGK